MFHQKRNTGLGFAVEGDIDGIEAGEVEFQLLEGDDEIAGAEMRIAWEHDFRGQIDAGHDEPAIGIDKVQPDFVRTLIFMAKGDAQGDGTLRVRGGDLLGDDGVKGAEKVQLAIFLSGRVAQDRNLNVHRRTD